MYWNINCEFPYSYFPPEISNALFWSYLHSSQLILLRRCQTPPSPPAPDPVGIENCKQLFSPLLAFTTQKIATAYTDIISAVCVAFFWVVNASRNEKSCLQFFIPTADFTCVLSLTWIVESIHFHFQVTSYQIVKFDGDTSAILTLLSVPSLTWIVESIHILTSKLQTTIDS